MKKILIIVAESSYFLSHRLSIACALRDKGFKVFIATTLCDPMHENVLKSEMLEFVDLKKRSKGFDIFSDLRFFFCLISIIRRISPDFILSVTIRVVFLSLLSFLFSFSFSSPRARFVGLIAGLGLLGASTRTFYKCIKSLVFLFIKCMCTSKKVSFVVQNPDDYKVISKLINKCRLFLILGSGVDVKKYFPLERNSSEFIKVTMASRMLKDKGVEELVEASRIITTDTPGCREICKDGENGLLVPPRNSQALSDAILTLASNPQMRIDMGMKSRMFVEQCFSSDIINNEMLRLFGYGDSTVSVDVGS